MMRTTKPNEPILARSSAQLVSDAAVRLEVFQRFVAASFDGSISNGDLDEMISCIVSMLSFDEVVFERSNDAMPMAVPLKKFMESLLGEQACSSMSGCVETDQSMQSI